MLTDAMNKITMKNSKQRSLEIKRHPTSNSSKIVYDRKIFLGAYSLRHEKRINDIASQTDRLRSFCVNKSLFIQRLIL